VPPVPGDIIVADREHSQREFIRGGSIGVVERVTPTGVLATWLFNSKASGNKWYISQDELKVIGHIDE
jgi:hypothetical protein